MDQVQGNEYLVENRWHDGKDVVRKMNSFTNIVCIPTYNNKKLAIGCVMTLQKLTGTVVHILDDSTDECVRQELEKYQRERKISNIIYHGLMEGIYRKNHISNWNRYEQMIEEGQGYMNIRHHDDYLLKKASCPTDKGSGEIDKTDMVINPVAILIFRLGRYSVYRYHCHPAMQRLLVNHCKPEILIYFNYIGPTACLWIRKEVAKGVGPFDEDMVWLVDVEWYMRLLKRIDKSRVKISELLINSSMRHQGSITREINSGSLYIKEVEVTRLVKQYRVDNRLRTSAFILRILNRIISSALLILIRDDCDEKNL